MKKVFRCIDHYHFHNILEDDDGGLWAVELRGMDRFKSVKQKMMEEELFYYEI